jgi:hypothetical protein
MPHILFFVQTLSITMDTKCLGYLSGEAYSLPMPLKKKFDEQDFKFTFEEKQVTQKKLDRTTIEKDLIYARKMERQAYLADWRRERLQAVDDYLEKVLIEEGDKKVLQRFQEEMKGKWKKGL